MSCCTEILDLGCIASCDTLDIIASAAGSDTFTIKAHDGAGKVIESTDVVTIGNPIQLDTSSGDYNRGYSYRLEVFDSSGAQVTDTVSSVVYDCWYVKIENTLT